MKAIAHEPRRFAYRRDRVNHKKGAMAPNDR
jgi:hypothetical protein